MNGESWLDAVSALIEEQSVEVLISRPDEDTLAITVGARGVVLHTKGVDAFLLPSVASGSTVASRLQERVVHYNAERFTVHPSTVSQAVETALAHLNPK